LASALLAPQLVAGVYRGLDTPAPDVLPLLHTLLLALGVVAWFKSYCKVLRITQPMDMGWFLLLAWPIVVPYFLISHEGRRGLHRIGFFVLAWLLAALVGALVGLGVAAISGPLDRGEDQRPTRAVQRMGGIEREGRL
jgi:hypothetical protein